MIQVVTLTGTLTNTAEHRNTTMMHGNVVNHFHHNNGLAAAGAAEESHFAAAGKWDEQVNNFNACLKHVDFGILLGKSRCSLVDRSHLVRLNRSKAINGPADNIHDPTQGIRAAGNQNGVSCVLGSHAPHQAVGLVHGNTADDIVT